MIIIFTLLAAIAFFVFLMSLTSYLRIRQNLDLIHRMRRHNLKQTTKGKEADKEDLKTRAYKFIQKLAKPLVERKLAQSLSWKMRQAGLPLLGGEYIIITIIASLAVALIVWLITLNVSFAVAGGAVVPLILWIIVLRLIKRRLNSFTEQLGDCLITIANALRAGYSFQQTVEVIAKEMEPPIGEEFSKINHDIFMGMPLEEALESANKRIGSSDFELVVTAILIQHEVGGNLAQILDNISYTIMERIRMKREVLALTAQGRLSAMVLLVLPFAVGVICFFMNHDNFVMIFEEPMGRMAMAGALILEIIGYFVIQRIVDIDT